MQERFRLGFLAALQKDELVQESAETPEVGALVGLGSAFLLGSSVARQGTLGGLLLRRTAVCLSGSTSAERVLACLPRRDLSLAELD